MAVNFVRRRTADTRERERNGRPTQIEKYYSCYWHTRKMNATNIQRNIALNTPHREFDRNKSYSQMLEKTFHLLHSITPRPDACNEAAPSFRPDYFGMTFMRKKTRRFREFNQILS